MSLFLRLVHGNEANPGIEDGISIDVFMAAMYAWQRGEVTRAEVIAVFGFTAADEADLDAIKGWYAASGSKPEFLRVLEGRLLMGQRKKTKGSLIPNGFFDYAVKSVFINGADGTSHLDSF